MPAPWNASSRSARIPAKIPGLSCSGPEEARDRAAQGFRYLTAGGDLGLMLTAAKAGLVTMGITSMEPKQ